MLAKEVHRGSQLVQGRQRGGSLDASFRLLAILPTCQSDAVVFFRVKIEGKDSRLRFFVLKKTSASDRIGSKIANSRKLVRA